MLALGELAGHSTFLEHYILDDKRDLMFGRVGRESGLPRHLPG